MSSIFLATVIGIVAAEPTRCDASSAYRVARCSSTWTSRPPMEKIPGPSPAAEMASVTITLRSTPAHRR